MYLVIALNIEENKQKTLIYLLKTVKKKDNEKQRRNIQYILNLRRPKKSRKINQPINKQSRHMQIKVRIDKYKTIKDTEQIQMQMKMIAKKIDT